MKEPENKSCHWYLFNYVFTYNPETGKLYWNISPCNAVQKGDEAGSYKITGRNKEIVYNHVRLDGKDYFIHRIAFCLTYGYMPKEVDHKDGDTRNNKISNLREATATINGQNKTRHTNNKSGCTGVCWYRQCNKWKAYIKVFGTPVHLGYFTDFDKAVDARKAAEARYGFSPIHGRTKKERERT